MEQLKEIALELLHEWGTANLAYIWENSTDIEQDEKEHEKRYKEYLNRIEKAVAE